MPQLPDLNAEHTFHVDLRGLVDLLSQHLYASPRVYLRELLQNAVDAVTARLALDPEAPRTIRISTRGGELRVQDSGVGLTERDVHELLATIGSSSKRGDFELARSDFLGQFGIGLLAAFVVADDIRVVSRSVRDADAPVVEWLASSDGSYTIATLPPEAHPEPGTTVYLTARRGSESWLEPGRVLEIARDYGSLLPHDIAVDGRPINDEPAPWLATHYSSRARADALAAHCEQVFGFTPLDAIPLDLPLVGVRGVAYVLPDAISPAHRAGHRVHLKGMLLTDRAERLLPDWAFFVRCVIDSSALRPTASREALYEDETLAGVREALGAQLRDWLANLAAESPDRLSRFLAIHDLGVRALAVHDQEMLRLMLPWLSFETTDGSVTLDELARRHQTVYFTRTVEEYRQVAAIAGAQGLAVVNGGYTYHATLVERFPAVRPDVRVAELDTSTVTAHLDLVDPADELALAGLLSLARRRLDALDCDVALRAFHPPTIAALHLDDRDARHERSRASAESEADDLWAGILASIKQEVPRALLVLNHRHPLVRRLGAMADSGLVELAVEALYGQALLMAARPLRPVDHALVNRTLSGLLEWAAAPPAEEPTA